MLRQAALVGGVLLTVVKLFGAQLIAAATKSPLLGSVVVVVGLLFWLNLIARIVVLSASWAAVSLTDREDPEAIADAYDAAGKPEAAGGGPTVHTSVRLVPPSTASAGVADPTVSRQRDRVAVVAGAVLGAAAATAVAGAARRWFSR